MRIKLVRKFADVVNGINLTKAHVGEVLEVTTRAGRVLIAEGWAEPVTAAGFSQSPSSQKSGSAESGA